MKINVMFGIFCIALAICAYMGHLAEQRENLSPTETRSQPIR